MTIANDDKRLVFSRVQRITGIAIPPKEQTPKVRETLQRLLELVNIDSMTKWLRKEQFARELGDRLKNLSPDEPATVVFLDINKFKTVNNILGQVGGDELIKQVATFMANNLRMNTKSKSEVLTQRRKQDSPADIGGRHGGDEFVILMHNCTPQQSEQALTRILEQLSQHEFKIDDITVKNLGLSFGCVSANEVPLGATAILKDELYQKAVEDLIKEADSIVKETKKGHSKEALYIRENTVIWSEDLKQKGADFPSFNWAQRSSIDRRKNNELETN